MAEHITVAKLMQKKRRLDDTLSRLIKEFEEDTGATLGAVKIENSAVCTRFDYVGIRVGSVLDE